jgi:ketol-acid reductoisomerase
MALNLRDSGWDVHVALRPGSKSHAIAESDGFDKVLSVAEAVRESHIVAFAFPDHCHRQTFENDIEPNLSDGTTLLFLHGTSIHFGLIKAPPGADVIMLAPHAPGVAVREKFLGDRSVSAFYAVHQDVSGRAKETVSAVANGIGIAEDNLIATTFAAEAVGDLFGEQVVLCGGLAMLIKSGFDTLVEKGLPPDNAYLEVAYQLDLIVDLIKKNGIEGMLDRISVAARYGALKTGPRIIDENTKKRMSDAYDDIASGRFVEELTSLTANDLRKMKEGPCPLSSPEFERAARKFSPRKKK